MFPTLSHLTEYLFGFRFPLPIQMYSLFIVFTFLGAYFVFRSEFKRKEKDGSIPMVKSAGKYVHPYQLCDNFLLIAIFFGFLGAKLFSILEYFDDFLQDPLSQLTSPSGLTFYGGFLLVCAAHFYYGTKKGIKAVHLADASCLGTLAGYGIGRLGCHLSGDGDWGIINLYPKPNWISWLPDWAWSYTFPHNAYKQGQPIAGCVGEYCTELSNGVYPTSLYEFVFCGLLFVLLWSIRKKIIIPGLLSIAYLLGSAIGRFFIEEIRINPQLEVFGLHLSQAQMIAIAIVVFCAIWLSVIWKNFLSKGKLNN